MEIYQTTSVPSESTTDNYLLRILKESMSKKKILQRISAQQMSDIDNPIPSSVQRSVEWLKPKRLQVACRERNKTVLQRDFQSQMQKCKAYLSKWNALD